MIRLFKTPNKFIIYLMYAKLHQKSCKAQTSSQTERRAERRTDIRTNGQTDMSRLTSLLMLMQNIYTLWDWRFFPQVHSKDEEDDKR